jgi:prophage regulatory protein
MDLENEMRFIRLKEVLDRTSIPKSTLMEMVSEEKFPAPVDLSTRSRAWVEAEVAFWMKEKIDARDKKIAQKTEREVEK